MRSPNRRHDLPFLYKYTTAATAIAILRNCSLRWSSPLLFNDPFDVPRRLELPFTSEQLGAAVVARVEDYMSGKAEPSSESAFAVISEMAKLEPSQRPLMMSIMEDSLHLLKVPTEIAMEQFRSAWEEKVRILRIACFSAVPDSPTLWAHYADDYKGVVLQFESSDERDSSFLLATEVVYREDAPALPLVDRWVRAFLNEEEVDWDAYFHECYYVKSPDWRSEREYRAISAAPGSNELFYDSPFFREDLRGVIMGPAIDGQHEAEIRRSAAAYPQATLYRARIDDAARRLVFDPVD